eukprot:scaffold205447_cov30-Tisochrysis_lutea.AAC.2
MASHWKDSDSEEMTQSSYASSSMAPPWINSNSEETTQGGEHSPDASECHQAQAHAQVRRQPARASTRRSRASVA